MDDIYTIKKELDDFPILQNHVGKGDGFIIPDGYFEDFEAEFETDAISFDIPKNYFGSLEEKIVEKVKTEDLKESKGKTFSLIRMSSWAVAACLGIWFVFNIPNEEVNSNSIPEVDFQDNYAMVVEHLDEFELDEIDELLLSEDLVYEEETVEFTDDELIEFMMNEVNDDELEILIDL